MHALFTDVWTQADRLRQAWILHDDVIGQDSGDVLALMGEGYNFDGTQASRALTTPRRHPRRERRVLVPNFYGAHGHNSHCRR